MRLLLAALVFSILASAQNDQPVQWVYGGLDQAGVWLRVGLGNGIEIKDGQLITSPNAALEERIAELLKKIEALEGEVSELKKSMNPPAPVVFGRICPQSPAYDECGPGKPFEGAPFCKALIINGKANDHACFMPKERSGSSIRIARRKQ